MTACSENVTDPEVNLDSLQVCNVFIMKIFCENNSLCCMMLNTLPCSGNVT